VTSLQGPALVFMVVGFSDWPNTAPQGTQTVVSGLSMNFL
jgi:hypothetical protein